MCCTFFIFYDTSVYILLHFHCCFSYLIEDKYPLPCSSVFTPISLFVSYFWFCYVTHSSHCPTEFAFLSIWLLRQLYENASTNVFRYITNVLYFIFIAVMLSLPKSSKAASSSITIPSVSATLFLFREFSNVLVPSLKYFSFSIFSLPSFDFMYPVDQNILCSVFFFFLLCISALSVSLIQSTSAHVSSFACLHVRCTIFCNIRCHCFSFLYHHIKNLIFPPLLFLVQASSG